MKISQQSTVLKYFPCPYQAALLEDSPGPHIEQIKAARPCIEITSNSRSYQVIYYLLKRMLICIYTFGKRFQSIFIQAFGHYLF